MSASARASESLTVLMRYFNAAKMFDTLDNLKEVSRHYNASYLATVAHCLKLHLVDRFTLKEIFLLGIANPDMPRQTMAEVVSVVKAIRMQRAINPEGYKYLIDDKAFLYHFCMASNIRVPRLYGVFHPLLVWRETGERLGKGDNWVCFFENEFPDSFVIKPALGLQGRSVYILDRNRDGFRDHSGRRYSAADLVNLLATHPDFDRWIIQEKVENHPDIVELTGTSALQTVRIVTGVNHHGQVSILLAAQKLVGTGEKGHDHFSLGMEGNHLAELSIADGKIVRALTGVQHGFELQDLKIHPKTGRALVGFQVPLWRDACEMVIDAARKFYPVKTIAWDVALTPDGPLVIEGNLDWSISSHSCFRSCRPFVEYYNEMSGKARDGRPSDKNLWAKPLRAEP